MSEHNSERADGQMGVHAPATTARLLSRCYRTAVLVVLSVASMAGWGLASADTTPTLFDSFAGNMNFIGTQRTLRTQADGGNACAVTGGATTANLTGLPAGATVAAAYLYWAGSGDAPDYNVVFEGAAVAADPARSYTATFTTGGTDYEYFSGVADVTAAVSAKGNGSYSFSGLTVDTGAPWCGSSAVMGGWALLVVYEHASEDFRVVNVYEGFQHFRGSDITLTPSNFLVPSSPINGRNAHLTWEGDVGNSAALNGFNEELTFNGNVLADASNPINNQFNSVSSINGDAASYGVDFDVFDISAYLAAGQTSATTVYSSGGDLVLLSAQVVSTTNTPAADLEIAMTRNGALTPGQSASYTLDVTNNGPLSEAGPITVTDTLPAGLSYVSASGTGWSCSAAGQVITCTRTGTLANGASAAALTLSVAVGAGATGSLTNTATVDGQNFDNVSANDTATDTYTLLPTPYAYYAMDEAAWDPVTDSSGNGRDASAAGATATGYPPPDPPGSAIPGGLGTCGAGAIPGQGGTRAVDTGIDVNDIGNAGTIAFWYSSNAAWNDGNDRMLFDASNNLGNTTSDKHFYLVKEGDGRLRFAFEVSAFDFDVEAQSGVFAFPADEWHHIAVTWDVGADVARLYLDGAEVATSNNTFSSLGDLATLYLGDQRMGGIGGTPGGYTSNSANGYLDEVRIYSGALPAAEVAQVMSLTHACAALVDHIRIEHASGTGLTCNSSTLTIIACGDASCSTFYTGGVTGSLTATGAPVVNFVGTAGFTIPAGSPSITKDFQVTTPGNTVLGTTTVDPAPVGASPVCNFGAPSCTFAAADSGFIFDVPDHTADTIQDITISAVRTDDNTQRCVPAFQNVTRTVNFWSGYLNPNSGTLAVSVNGGAIAGASPGTGADLAFDANGDTTVQVRYADVGQMNLTASHAGSGDSAGLVMLGQDSFVARPARFVLSIPGNPGDAVDETGSVFRRAGEDFSITVTAQNASNAVTPNYGRESPSETVTLATALVAPAGGNDPPVTGAFGVFGEDCDGNPAAAGTACGTFNWSEVGIITLTPSVGDADYLGTGDISGAASGNIGRFTPYDFNVAYNAPEFAASCGAFTYIGQPFFYATAPAVTVTARNAAGGTTQNYSGAWWKITDTSLTGKSYSAAAGALDTGALPAPDPVITPTGAGVGTLTFSSGVSGIAFNRGNPIAPFDADISLSINVRDEDDIVYAGNPARFGDATAGNGIAFDGGKAMRYGRLALTNAFGSELLPLPMPMHTQYYASDASGFIANGGDGCSAVPASDLRLFNGATTVDGAGPIAVGSQTTSATIANSPFAGGAAGLSFSAPQVGGDGFVDVTIVPGQLPAYLQFDWDGDGLHDNDPQGRATFGIYRGSPRQIYRRERY